jgi:hypothetical protein
LSYPAVSHETTPGYQQEANRRSLQSGGILYASDARAMVWKKEEKREADQVAAAQRVLERAEEAEQKRQ